MGGKHNKDSDDHNLCHEAKSVKEIQALIRIWKNYVDNDKTTKAKDLDDIYVRNQVYRKQREWQKRQLTHNVGKNRNVDMKPTQHLQNLIMNLLKNSNEG